MCPKAIAAVLHNSESMEGGLAVGVGGGGGGILFFIPICFRAHYSNFSVKTSAPEKVLVPCAVQYVLPLSLRISEPDSIFAPSEPLIHVRL